MILSPTHFTAGDVVNIYTDYINGKGFEGAAVLIEKQSNGCSLIMCDENLFTKLEEKPITEEGHIPLTANEISRNKKHSLLKHYLLGDVRSGVRHVNNELNNLYKLLASNAEPRIDNPQILADILFRYRVKWKKARDEKANFFQACTNDEIIRFVYQTEYGNKWTHSIFREESWVVDFCSPQYDAKTKQCYFWSNGFRTVRKLKKLVCICYNDDPQKSELILHKTNGKNISNFDKRILRDLRKHQLDQEIDEENEHVDLTMEDDSDFDDVDEIDYDMSLDLLLDDMNPSDEDLRNIENEIFLTYDDDDQEIV